MKVLEPVRLEVRVTISMKSIEQESPNLCDFSNGHSAYNEFLKYVIYSIYV